MGQRFSKYHRVSLAAKSLGLGRQTVFAAINRGEIPVATTGCGLRLVRMVDLEKWAKKDRKPGPKPAK